MTLEEAMQAFTDAGWPTEEWPENDWEWAARDLLEDYLEQGDGALTRANLEGIAAHYNLWS